MFQLQFPVKEIRTYASRYAFKEDMSSLDAGKRILDGQYTRENLEIIYRWKTKGRGIARLKKNSDSEIADALRLAVSAKTERSAIAVLTGLYGVAVPVASAIMTAINPKKYTIIDFRALEALGSGSTDRSVDFYLTYLEFCKTFARENGVDMRTLDRALWRWSSEK